MLSSSASPAASHEALAGMYAAQRMGLEAVLAARAVSSRGGGAENGFARVLALEGQQAAPVEGPDLLGGEGVEAAAWHGDAHAQTDAEDEGARGDAMLSAMLFDLYR